MPSSFRALKQLALLFRYWQHHPLASRDLPGTVARFLRWQLGGRLLGMPALMPWVGSTTLVIESGMTGATMNLYCGLHEAADMAFVLHVLRPGDAFLDVGANVGTYTVLASGVAQAHTVALEPIPSTFERLMRNLRLNDLLCRVEPRCLAVGAHAGSVRFTASRDTTNRAVSLLPSPNQEPTVEVPLISLDQLRQEADTHALRRTMEQAGFCRYHYDLFSRSLSSISGPDSSSGHNQLWIRDLPFVQQRCRTAPPVRVNGVEL